MVVVDEYVDYDSTVFLLRATTKRKANDAIARYEVPEALWVKLQMARQAVELIVAEVECARVLIAPKRRRSK